MKTVTSMAIGAIVGSFLLFACGISFYKMFRSVNDRRLDRFNAEQFAEKLKNKAQTKIHDIRDYFSALYNAKKEQISQPQIEIEEFEETA